MKNINKSTGYFLVTVFWLVVLTFWSVKTQAQTFVSTTPENKNVILETPEEVSRTHNWWQILNITIYFIIVILSYTFCLS